MTKHALAAAALALVALPGADGRTLLAVAVGAALALAIDAAGGRGRVALACNGGTCGGGRPRLYKLICVYIVRSEGKHLAKTLYTGAQR